MTYPWGVYTRDMEALAQARKAILEVSCPNGHWRTPDNTRYDNRGQPHCRLCEAAAARRYRNKNRPSTVQKGT